MKKNNMYMLSVFGLFLFFLLCFVVGKDIACASDVEGVQKIAAADDGFNYRLGGYLRTWASFNLEDPPETSEDDKGDLSMLRGSLSINADVETGKVQWKAIARADREYKTDYLERLEDLIETNTPGGPGSDMDDFYNSIELREFYADVPLGRLQLRVGRQQVVWGETDFFHLMDLIHGFDYSWRSFIARETDEIRKPLNLLNATLNMPELNGTLQLVVRPGSGLNRERDIGNTFDVSGGRWATQPVRGYDFLKAGGLTMNYRYTDGDADDTTGGVRWTGVAGPVNYSLSYLKTFNPNPVVNSSFVPYKEVPKGALGDFVYPEIDVFGMSASSYIPALDVVVSGEIAFQEDVPYNVGGNFFGGALPGFGGIKEKDVFVSSIRLDKQLRLMHYLGTNQATFFSVQLFDTWIRKYDDADDLVQMAGYGAAPREHTTYLTGFFTLNYFHSKVNPGLAFGVDLSNKDIFFIPSVEVQWGNHWRFVVEGDFFVPNSDKDPSEIEKETRFLGYFANGNQLLLRATYQF